MRKLFSLILIVIFGLIAVSPGLAQDGGATALEITSPKEGDLITGDEILLNIKYSGESGNHAHIWLDEQNPSEDNAKTLEDPGPFLFRDVKPGDHTIIVELAGDDHKPIDSAQKITLKVKTRSAADVTQEEIAKALSQVKPAENINSNQPSLSDCATKGGCDTGAGVIKKSKSSILILIIEGIVLLSSIGGLIFLFLRRKKQG